MTTPPSRISIGADHRGTDAARNIAEMLKRAGHQVTLVETNPDGPTDYPEQAWKVGQAIRDGDADRGVLICGTGIGMSIAANKVPGVRAAVVHDELSAQLSRSHNDANVVCLSADLVGERLMEKIVEAFMKAPFEGGRHERRVNKISEIEQGQAPTEQHA